MPVAPERLAGWLGPKWLVVGVALAADGLLMSYDLRLGIAASVLLGVIAAMWLYLALRYGSLSGAPSGRSALVAQVRVQESNRRSAAAITRGESGPQDRPNPTQRP
ncbi:hypothetical protein C0V72_09850 [Porphyrobacter sp. TH134]|uniref:hypothetical protein n=1 Tax=Porphyrobacter sp. TH134 TaxID=2067450 RepID=UPI000C7C9621|nr:hypothetical protein [Porphyrobacter sp. TH134]PLK23365.1 hypothetical protein C0V72_09850 [Porphyrobacter sp. TH134]